VTTGVVIAAAASMSPPPFPDRPDDGDSGGPAIPGKQESAPRPLPTFALSRPAAREMTSPAG
jgi:hypothetical protein